MISSVVYTSPRARLVSARQALKPSVLLPAQKRSFGSGSRFSDAGRGGHRDLRRSRHRQLRDRHLEQPSRSLSWENGSPSDKSIPPFLRSKSFADAKYADVSNIKSWSDDISGIRPAKNIEHVEREAIDKLFRKHYNSTQHFDKLRLPFQNVRDYIQAWNAPAEPPKTVDASQVIEATSRFPPVPRARNAKPVQKQQFSDLGGYSPKTFDNPNTPRKLSAEERSKKYNDLHKYRPVEWNEPNGLQSLTAEELSKNYKDLDSYAPSKFDAVADVAAEKTKYDDLHKYKPVEWNEPDGLRQPTAEELTKNYKDLDKYEAVRWNEPHGLQQKTPEELSKNYKDLDSYVPAEFNEPEGLRPLTAEEESKQYEDLDKYAEGFMAKDSVLEAHDAKQMDTTVRGNMLPPKVEVATEDFAQKYDDLGKYGPVLWNEPDGLRPPTAEELSKNYEDLHLYAQYDNAGPREERIHPEEASKQYEDLHMYAQYDNAGPKEPRIHPEEASKRYSDLSKYPRAGYEEPAVKEHVHPEELTKNYRDLAKYQPASFDAPHRAYPSHPEALSKNYDDLHLYKPIFHNEPDGQIANAAPMKDGLAEYDTKLQRRAFATTTSTKHRSVSPLSPQAHRRATNLEFAKVEYETSWEAAEQANAEEPAGEVGAQARQRYVNLEEAKEKYQSSWDPEPAADVSPVGIEARANRLVDNLEASKTEYEAEWDAAPTSGDVAESIEAEARRRLEQLEKSKAKTERAFDAPSTVAESSGIAAQTLESGWDVAPAALESIEAEAERQPGNTKASESVLESGWNVAPAALESIEAEASLQPDNSTPAQPVLESGWDVAPAALENIEAEADRQGDNLTAGVSESGSIQTSHSASVAQATDSVLESGWKVTPAAIDSIEEVAVNPPKPFQSEKVDYGVEWDAPAPVEPKALEAEADRRVSSLDDAKAKYETAFEQQVDIGEVDGSRPGASTSAAERDDGVSSMDESFPPEGTGIRDAMQRLSGTYGQQPINTETRIQAETDPYSKSPQGLETSYFEEIGGKATWPTMVRHYRSEGSPQDDAATAADASDAATYVVLAFDPLTQSVNVAETSSTVEHVGSTTTPAEAILRLSNPSKFFPHFKPLQEQGYEIISGRGDVLIFHKVRAATTNARAYDPSKHLKRRRSLGKKLVVGTVSVAGAAYAIGVLGEYVSTRGTV